MAKILLIITSSDKEKINLALNFLALILNGIINFGLISPVHTFMPEFILNRSVSFRFFCHKATMKKLFLMMFLQF